MNNSLRQIELHSKCVHVHLFIIIIRKFIHSTMLEPNNTLTHELRQKRAILYAHTICEPPQGVVSFENHLYRNSLEPEKTTEGINE